MRLGLVDVGNSRTKRACWDGRRILPWHGGRVDAWVGCRVGRGPVPPGTLLLGRDFPPLVRIRTRRPDRVGADRLAQASGAWRRVGGACVVVSMGTAITVDVVGPAGDFRGGLIAPGLRLLARALHEHTALLPEIEPRRTRDPVGRDTASAIRAGVSMAASGLLREALRKARGPVIGTGGDAAAYRDFFDELVPGLALEGVLHAYLCTSRS
jgi:pantothenate kinase type III